MHITEATSRTVDSSYFLYLLNAVSATGAGEIIEPYAIKRVFQVIISDTATCKLQASIDGTNWIDLRESTASEGFSTAEPWPYVRGNVSAYTSGTVTLLMAS